MSAFDPILASGASTTAADSGAADHRTRRSPWPISTASSGWTAGSAPSRPSRRRARSQRPTRSTPTLARGEDPGPLAGVPFAVKNLFDIAGVVTLAGSKINRDHAPAATRRDAGRRGWRRRAPFCSARSTWANTPMISPARTPMTAPRATRTTSPICRAARRADRAPRSPAGFVPLALGSDTNGSIRVPSSLCGLFGLKPTFGRLTRGGTFPFVASLDHLGPLARSAADLALAYDAMQGPTRDDPACTRRRHRACLRRASPRASRGLRIAIADGYFATGAMPEAFEAVAARRRGPRHGATHRRAACRRRPGRPATSSRRARAPRMHLTRLQTRPDDFDPDVRDRLIAGAMVPGAWVTQAHKVRRWFHDSMMRVFEETDILLAPSTPCRAPRLGQKTMSARRGRDGRAAQSRHLHPAHLVGRACQSRRCRSGPRGSACPSACRSSRRHGERISPSASRTRWRRQACASRRWLIFKNGGY